MTLQSPSPPLPPPPPPPPSASTAAEAAASQGNGDRSLMLRYAGGWGRPGIPVAISGSLLPDCGLGSDVLLKAPRRRLVEADDRVMLVDLVAVDVSKEA